MSRSATASVMALPADPGVGVVAQSDCQLGARPCACTYYRTLSSVSHTYTFYLLFEPIRQVVLKWRLSVTSSKDHG